MSSDSIFSLLFGIPIGIVSGFYTGLIVTRYTRFSDLRNEVLRVIRNINFIQEDEALTIRNDQDLSKFALVTSDLLFLKHRKAAEAVKALSSDIYEMNAHARSGRLSIEAYNQSYLLWQTTARSLSANKLVIWSLWAKL